MLVQKAASWSSLLLLSGTAVAQPAPPPPPANPPAVTPSPPTTFSYYKKAQPTSAAAPSTDPALVPAPLPPPAVLQPVSFQPPADRQPGGAAAEEAPGYQVQLEPPGPQRLFQLESEAQLRERMRQEARERTPPERITFPEEPVVSRETYKGRQWPPSQVVVEPNYVCHRRLLFEQRNAERYGWDLGPAHPFFSTAVFVKDVVTLPFHLGSYPCRKYECSAGLCLPGDPVPFLFYPPELTLTGLVAQAAVVGGLLAIFP
jgi:hypothetical protein